MVSACRMREEQVGHFGGALVPRAMRGRQREEELGDLNHGAVLRDARDPGLISAAPAMLEALK